LNKSVELQSTGGMTGIVKRGKQNNFRIGDLMEKPVNWNNLIKEIDKFLISKE